MKCPNCGSISDDNSLFCENCGMKLNNQQNVSQPQQQNVSQSVNTQPVNNYNFEYKKIQILKLLAVLSIIVSLVALFGAFNTVRVINSDRLMLYPMLSLFLSFYCSFKLVEYEETYLFSVIVVIVSTLLFIVSAIL